MLQRGPYSHRPVHPNRPQEAIPIAATLSLPPLLLPLLMVSSTHDHHDWLRKHKFTAPVRREEVERDWKPRGFSCKEFSDPPGGKPGRWGAHGSACAAGKGT